MIFRKAPVLLLGGKSPERFREDVDLLGTSFEGYAKSVVEETIVMGRCGTLVDFDGEGEQRAYLAFYKAEDILNWRQERVNGRLVLTLLVLQEFVSETGADEFEHLYESYLGEGASVYSH